MNRKINAHIESGCPSVPKKHANPCSFPGCTKGELTPIVCKGCGKNFCLSHRFEDNHACVGRGRGRPAPAVATSSQPRTQAILAAAKAKPKSATTHGFATTKRNPEGDRRIRPEDRVMLAIQFSPGTGLPGRHMFFNAEWTVGRVIDAIAESTKGAIRNNNNVVPDEQKLHLFVKKTGRMLPMDRKLKDLTGDPATKPPLKAGDMVMLQRGLTLEIPRKEDKCTTS